MIFRQALLCSFLIAVAFAAPTTKIQPQLAASLKAKNQANIFVKFQDGNAPALRAAARFLNGSRTEQINHLVSSLKSLSQSTQQNALNLLKTRFPFSSYQQFWISNELYVKAANTQLVQELALLPEVEEIHEELVIPLQTLQTVEVSTLSGWNMERIEAEEAWQLPGGNNGQGAVVANLDTGVRRTHEALSNNQRATYNWFDPYDGSAESGDLNGAGTHATGVAVGAGGIGVAPGAQWIACRGCRTSSCTEAAILACGQWVVCPTLANGQSPDCSMAPRIVFFSWGGGQGAFWDSMFQSWIVAGIVPVSSNGNNGPNCGTATASSYELTVGSSRQDDSFSVFSSAGPSVKGGIKPDLCAPGSDILTAGHTSDTAYISVSSTGVAAAHVAGAAALLVAQNPSITIVELRDFLQNNAERNLPDTGRECGGIPSTVFPNNQYGYGRLNARRALADALGIVLKRGFLSV